MSFPLFRNIDPSALKWKLAESPKIFHAPTIFALMPSCATDNCMSQKIMITKNGRDSFIKSISVGSSRSVGTQVEGRSRKARITFEEKRSAPGRRAITMHYLISFDSVFFQLLVFAESITA